jgi:hypothetical protein
VSNAAGAVATADSPAGSATATTTATSSPIADRNNWETSAHEIGHEIDAHVRDEFKQFNSSIVAHAYCKLVQRIGDFNASRILFVVPLLLPAQRAFGDVRKAMEDGADATFPQAPIIRQIGNEVFDQSGLDDNSRRPGHCPGASA